MTHQWDEQVASSAADVKQAFGNGNSITATSVALRNSAGFDPYTGSKFLPSIPQGARIQAASIEVSVNSADTGGGLGGTSMAASIKAQAIDNAPDFNTNVSDLSGRATTSASISWVASLSDGAAFTASPDISSVIQEIVSRVGWASGNGLAIILTATSASAVCSVRQFDFAGNTFGMKLHVTYALPEPPFPNYQNQFPTQMQPGGPAGMPPDRLSILEDRHTDDKQHYTVSPHVGQGEPGNAPRQLIAGDGISTTQINS